MNTFPKELMIDKGQTLILESSILLLCFTEATDSKQLSTQLKKLEIEVIDNPNGNHA